MFHQFQAASYLKILVALVCVLFMAWGCGHRTVRTSSQYDKTGAGVQQSSDSLLGSEEDAVDDFPSDAMSSVDIGSEVEDVDSLDGPPIKNVLLEEDPFRKEDDFLKTELPSESSQAYWDQRQEAELVTLKAGLRDIFFHFNSWRLTEEAKRTLVTNAGWLKEHPDTPVTIEGHCDERGTRSYNYILGEKRAMIVRNYLAGLGIPPTQLVVMSYGKDNPRCQDPTEDCYQQNRRAHLILGINVASAIE